MLERINYSIEPTQPEDIPEVIDLLSTEPNSVIPLTPEQLSERMGRGHSYVARDSNGKILGHQGALIWPQSELPELGSAVVLESHRNKGISTALKKKLIPVLQEQNPGVPIVSFTEAGSMSRGILKKMGFEEMPMKEVPEEFFSICPASEERCYGKTREDSPACGCIVYMLKPKLIENGE